MENGELKIENDQLVPPEGWREVRLGDVAELSKTSWKLFDEAYPYIGLEHINENKLRLNGIGDSNSVASNKYRFNSGDILFGKLRPYFRKVVLAKFDGICSTDIWVVKPKDKTDNIFLFYFFANPVLVDISYSSSSGTRMPRADWSFLADTLWQIPLLPEQKAIAEVLSSLDDKIDLLHRQNKTLEEIAQTLFRQWFVNFNYPDNTGEMAKSKLGEIPKGWRVGKLKDITDKISKGTTPRKEEFENLNRNIPFLKVKDITDSGTIKLNSLELIPFEVHDRSLNRSKLQENDILFSIAGTIGRVSIVPHILDNSNCNQAIAFIRIIHKEFFLEYVHQWIKSQEVQFEIKSNIVQGVQANVSLTVLGNLQILIPSESIMMNWNDFIKPTYQKSKSNMSQIRTLENLRDILLPKLMSGEVRINTGENNV